VTYYLADHLGSVAQITTSAGAVSLTREYDPWGNLLQGAGSSGFAFTGREWDSEIALHYYRARYYDANRGRFLAEDPAGFGAGTNRYVYVLSRPVVAKDPSGLKLWVCARPVDQPWIAVGYARHEYLWSDREGRSCGYGSRYGAANDKAPGANPWCTPVPNSDSAKAEKCGMDCCRDDGCQNHTPLVKNTPSPWQSWLPSGWGYRNCWDTVTCALSRAQLPYTTPPVGPVSWPFD
jgi:RHS repeat-associated protein